MRHFKLMLLLLSIINTGCQDDEEVSTQQANSYDLNGYVQKGPFINGTAITASELDQTLIATGKNFTTQIIDNKGSFSFKGVALESDYVQLIAEGFYFDEVRGEKSAAQLTLFALADVSDVNSVNVNLLSHLEKDRVTYLMQEEELSFATAKQQAQREILTMFGIEKSDMTASELLDISQDGDDNAILLAISAILQGDNTVAELSELLADIITDIREDGVLDSESTQEKIRVNAMSLTLADIRKHLEVRYEELGVDATIPNFEQYVDSDGDGFLNKDEDDTPNEFAFEPQVDVAINDTVTSNTITISGLKEGGVARASVARGWLVVNGSVMATSVSGAGHRDTLSIAKVKNGDQLKVRLVTSSQFADTTKATLTIGSVVQSFEATTDDYSPDPFTFKEVTDARLETIYVSDTVTVSGLPHPVPEENIWFSFKNDSFHNAIYVNGKKHTSNNFSLKNGDQLWIEILSPEEYQAERTASLTVNDKSAEFIVTASSYPLREISSFPGKPSRLTSFSIGQYFFTGTVSEYASPSASKKFFKYDTVTDKWLEISDFPGIPRNGSIAFSANGKAYVGLGHNTNEGFLQDLWVYDPELNLWSQSTDFPGTARAYASTFTISNNIYIGLGYYSLQYGLGHNPSTLTDFWKLDATTNRWTQISNFPGEERTETICFSTSNKGYVGVSNRFNHNTEGELWKYDQEKNQWVQKASFPSPQETSGGQFSIDERGFVIFGYEGYIREYNSLQNVWLQVKKDISVDGITGVSVLAKGYIIDTKGKLYEFTPPQE